MSSNVADLKKYKKEGDCNTFFEWFLAANIFIFSEHFADFFKKETKC